MDLTDVVPATDLNPAFATAQVLRRPDRVEAERADFEYSATFLNPAGVGDDVTVALGLADEDAPVVNLSLGGYTHDDQPPTAPRDALGQLDDSVVVVAAAGNHGSPQPFWPAAFKGVVAVGALDTTSGRRELASFSNYGHWVDIYAPGTRVRGTYLRGKWKLPTDPAPWHLGGWAHWSGTASAQSTSPTPGIIG
jgi:hypothetical protein